MGDPETHTLHLFREIREDIQWLDRKVDKRHAEAKGLSNGSCRHWPAKWRDRSYAAGGVERRLADIERRLAALEEQQ